MPKEWDDNKFPIAYLLTFRTYSTWHHGDDRGAVDRKHFHRYGTPAMPRSPELVEAEVRRQKQSTFILNDLQRDAVNAAIIEVCRYRGYKLHALNIRTNHAHAVVWGEVRPEKIVEAFKSYATRKLRGDGLIGSVEKVWSRHASTRYLWEDRRVVSAVDYVLYSQGDEFPNL